MFTANFQRTPTVRTFLKTSIAVVSQREQTLIVSQQVNKPLQVGRGGVMAKAMARIKARKLERASAVSTSEPFSFSPPPAKPLSKIQLPSEQVSNSSPLPIIPTPPSSLGAIHKGRLL